MTKASPKGAEPHGQSEADLLAELAGGPARPEPVSRVDEILALFGPEARAGLELALANGAWSTAHLCRVINKHHRLGETTLRRYRRERFGV